MMNHLDMEQIRVLLTSNFPEQHPNLLHAAATQLFAEVQSYDRAINAMVNAHHDCVVCRAYLDRRPYGEDPKCIGVLMMRAYTAERDSSS